MEIIANRCIVPQRQCGARTGQIGIAGNVYFELQNLDGVHRFVVHSESIISTSLARSAAMWAVSRREKWTEAESPHTRQDAQRHAVKLWIDVTDIVDKIGQKNPITGIQRALLELLKIFSAYPNVKICAFEPDVSVFVELSIRQLLSRSANLGLQRELTPAERFEKRFEKAKARIRKSAVSLVPKTIRRKLGLTAEPRKSAVSFKKAEFAEGDVLAQLSAFWYHREQTARILNASFVHRMKLAVLVYDLIPLNYPEWFGTNYSLWWSEKLKDLLRGADFVFAISNFVASQTVKFAFRHGIEIGAVRTLRFGDTLLGNPSASASPRDTNVNDNHVFNQQYVLVVGTIDVRKNQASLLPIWRRLLRELGAERTPNLLLIGGPGLRSDEFQKELSVSAELRRKVVVLADITDQQLAGYYRGALFTVFPTLAEGWGFPVSESLSFGKVCLASNIDSIAEVGGQLACYFDPHDPNELYELVERFILNPGERERWEARIRTEYRLHTWDETVNSLLSGISSDASIAANK